MGATTLGSRGIIGEFFARLEQDIGNSWVPMVTNYFSSDQEAEDYRWLGHSPQMQEWVGGRVAKGFREAGQIVRNKHYEATMEVLVSELRRDKTEQIRLRIAELAQRANAHWIKLLSDLLIAAEAAPCYDGQFFFDTDHEEGSSGVQSNDISSDIGTPTDPTPGEMSDSITRATQAILGFKDDQGEPMNELAREFLVMVPLPYMKAAAAALGTEVLVQNATAVASNVIRALGSIGGFQYSLATNVRLPWTTKFALFRIDSPIKSLIRQEEMSVQMKAKAEGSDFEFDNDMHQYGVDTWRNVAYGLWQRACLVTHT